MNSSARPRFAGVRLRAVALIVCALALAGAARASGDSSAPGAQALAPGAAPAPGTVSATLQECFPAVSQGERSATFAGEMTALSGSPRMSIRITLLERMAGEAAFHTVDAPGLGVWRASDPKVKVYKYLKQVTNLSAPAAYRALVGFRWLTARGHVIKSVARLTAACEQPSAAQELASPPTQLPGGSSSG